MSSALVDRPLTLLAIICCRRHAHTLAMYSLNFSNFVNKLGSEIKKVFSFKGTSSLWHLQKCGPLPEALDSPVTSVTSMNLIVMANGHC